MYLNEIEHFSFIGITDNDGYEFETNTVSLIDEIKNEFS